jgi:hypothetical protein
VLDAKEFALTVLPVVIEAEESCRGWSCALRLPIASEAERDLFLVRREAETVSKANTSP